jgi:CRISPR/Cas system CMR subunit Cmr4 (Cas7 group RAMP superfamily)
MREKLKLYYCCRFTQLSPLRLSGGKNDRTDNDLMLDSRGLPMIPGSALAGVLRGRLTREEANLLFGRDTVGDAMTESAVLVGDVALPADAKVRFATASVWTSTRSPSPRQNMTLRRRSAARLTPL